jgi:uncharacterized protein (TIGR03067 family)
MKTRILLLLVTGFLVASAFAQPAQTDLEKIKGTWVVTSIQKEGKTIDNVGDLKFVFSDAKMTVTEAQNEDAAEGTFKLDPSKNPREIDIAYEKGPQKGTKMKGIYAVEGDSLKMCFCLLKMGATEQAKVPAKFEGSEVQIYFVLQRQKP